VEIKSLLKVVFMVKVAELAETTVVIETMVN
jgi:hypothetical protein